MAQQNSIIDLVDSGKLAQVQSRLSKQTKSDRFVDRCPGANDRGEQEKNFARVYKEVADTNKAAQCGANGQKDGGAKRTDRAEREQEGNVVAEKKTARALVRDTSEENKEAAVAAMEHRQAGTTEDPSEIPSEEVGIAVQASVILRESLTVISETLDLDIAKGLEGLEIHKPHEGVIEQFSEIVDALTQIAALLSQAAQEGESVVLAGKKLTGQEVAEAEKTIRVETFHMEVAFRMLGVSRDVAEGIAVKQDMPLDLGLATASDPLGKSMPVEQVQQVFGELIAAREEEIRSLLSKVAALIKSQEKPSQPVFSSLENSASGKQERPGPIGESVFDSLIMRKILKIDMESVEHRVAQGNSEAAEGTEKLNVGKAWQIPMSHPLTELLPTQDQQDLSPVLQAIGKENGVQNIASLMGSKVTDLLMKNVEQSVMEQLTSKVHHAVRSGLNEVRLVLHPDSLGEVRLKIEVHQEVVFAKINVENAQVRQIVEAHLGQLKDALEQHNLTAGGFEVNVNSGSHQDADSQEVVHRGHGAPDDDVQGADHEYESKERALGTDTGKRYGNNSFEYFA